jgi:hypothetical protein
MSKPDVCIRLGYSRNRHLVNHGGTRANVYFTKSQDRSVVVLILVATAAPAKAWTLIRTVDRVSVAQFFSNLTLNHPYNPLSKTQFTIIEDIIDNI